MNWRIYYGNGDVVRGTSAAEWRAAPDDGVQVVVLMEPPERPQWTYRKRGMNHPVFDRQLWTGTDEYDPFGWGAKRGSQIADAAYAIIWNFACSD